MHEHIPEEELAELALNAEHGASPMLNKLADCASCRDTYDRYARLRTAVAALPMEASPRPDLWASLSMNIEHPRPVSHVRRPMWTRGVPIGIAAGVAAVAFALGRASAMTTSRAGSDLPTDAYHAAIELQEAGTDYLTVLAVLRRLDGPASVRAQGRAAALATLRGAALELAEGEGPNSVLALVASTLAAERDRVDAPDAALRRSRPPAR